MSERIHKIFAASMGIFVLLILWHVVCQQEIFSSYVLPSPQKVWKTFCKMVESHELWIDIWVSCFRVIKGFVIAFVLAFALGMIQILLPGLRKYYDYLLQFLKNVPPLSLIPLLILWFGIHETTKTIIIVLASFFPMYLNIVKGFTTCDVKLIEVGKIFNYTKFQIFKKIIFPFAMRDILIGMKIGLGYSWRAIIGAEMVAASSGLGHLILFAQQTSRTDKVIVGIFAIGFIGYLSDVLFGKFCSRYLRGKDTYEWD